ncbi:MAG: ATPase [Lachnospiraceae bacterium]|nr:ATPase [Lachnospiraceae bacterium]
MLYDQIQAARQHLEVKINSLKLRLCNFPEGNLFCSHNGKYTKWYLSDGKNQTYIPKSQRQFAETLAAKKYLALQLEDLLQEKEAIDSYLKRHTDYYSQSMQTLTKDPAYQELLNNHFALQSRALQTWANSPYEKNLKFPEQLIHKTTSGILVRSKSEALIATLLYVNKIPFRYECALQLGEQTIFPDFTIRHPQNDKIFYWEHFGLMDDPSYCKNTHSKLQLYTSHKIIPTIHLITTYETKENPLSSELIQQIINYHFL